MAHITKDTVMSKHTTPLEAMGLGGASALLLEAIQALFPPRGKHPATQRKLLCAHRPAIMLGAVALTVIINHFRSSKEDDTTDDADDESNTPFL